MVSIKIENRDSLFFVEFPNYKFTKFLLIYFVKKKTHNNDIESVSPCLTVQHCCQKLKTNNKFFFVPHTLCTYTNWVIQ